MVSSYSIAAGIIGFLSASFIDRFCRKKILVYSYLGFVAGTAFCGVAHSYEVLIAARILTGGFGGVAGALLLSIVGDIVPYERRSTALSIVALGFQFAAVLGVPLGLMIGDKFGWQGPFYFIAGLGVIIAILVQIFLPSLTNHIGSKAKRNMIAPFIEIAKNANQLRAMGFALVLLFGQFIVIPFLSDYLVANVGFEKADLKWVYLAGGLSSMVAFPFIGRLSDKYGNKKVFTMMLFISIVPIVLVTNLPPLPMYLVLLVNGLFFMFVGGRIIPANTLIISTATDETRASFMSVRTAVMHVGSGVAANVAGLIVSENDQGQMTNYPYVGLVSVAMAFTALYLMRKIKVVA